MSRVGISEDSGAPLADSGTAPDSAFTRVGFSVLDLAVSPNGAYLGVSTDHSLHFLYKPGTSTIVRWASRLPQFVVLFVRDSPARLPFPLPRRRVCGHRVGDMSSVRLAWHPTSAFLASTSDRDNCVYVWDVRTEAVLATVCPHASRVRSVVCWADERTPGSAYFLSASFDRTVQVWPAPWSV